MKKIFFAIVAVAAITFSACGGSTQAGAENDSIQSDSLTIEEPADAAISALTSALKSANAADAQSALEKAQAYIAQLQAEGKLEEAKAYISKVQQYIADNEEQINALTSGNATIASLVSAVKGIPTTAESGADAIAADAATASEAANAAASAAAETAKTAANDAAEAAKNTAKEKASDAVDNAAAAVKGKLGL